MRVRGARRRRALDRGFVLSDHADWPGLMQAIDASGARRVIVTHGFEAAIVRHLPNAGLLRMRSGLNSVARRVPSPMARFPARGGGVESCAHLGRGGSAFHVRSTSG